MKEDSDSKQQELPAWRSEEPTPAGPSAANSNQQGSNPPTNTVGKAQSEGCCTKFMSKCGPIGWYFSPIFGKFGYSLTATFYHLVMFAFTLATFIIIVTLFSVSVGLLILVFGFILFWWTCEISVFLARVDLALAYYMVEDDATFIANSKHLLKLNFYSRVAACPCSQQSRNQGGSCCNRLMSRMKSIACQCEMYKIFLFQMIIKPIIVSVTWWILIVVAYVFASVFAPIVYLASSRVFTNHYWCPLNDTSCNDDVCKCELVSVENFWDALLFGICAFLLLPFVFHVSIWFAKVSKVTSYYFVSNYYNSSSLDPERNNLLVSSVRSDSVSQDQSAPQTAGIVHSLNNPYVNDV